MFQLERGRASSCTFITTGHPSHTHAIMGGEWLGQLFCAHDFWASSPSHLPVRQFLLCCPNKMQGLFYLGLWWWGGEPNFLLLWPWGQFSRCPQMVRGNRRWGRKIIFSANIIFNNSHKEKSTPSTLRGELSQMRGFNLQRFAGVREEVTTAALNWFHKKLSWKKTWIMDPNWKNESHDYNN